LEVLSSLGLGFSIALQPHNLAFCLIGVVLGTLLGVLPGLGPSAGIAILLPVTFGMDPVPAIIMLAGIYYGAMYGGTITSVLINVPGESASVMTCLDGYQLARQGRAGAALGMAAVSSFVAGTAGVVALMVLAPWLADFAVSFGPPEYFTLMLMGLSTVAGLVSGSPLKALIMGVLGLMLGTVGYDVVTGRLRFTLGVPDLADGVHFIIVAIGLFGVGEILASVEDRSHVVHIPRVSLSSVFPTVADWVACRWAILRGTIVGFVVGVLPGAGATVASFLAYALEKKASKHPENLARALSRVWRRPRPPTTRRAPALWSRC
jgi:putative tricarboxylic transport membrane protein